MLCHLSGHLKWGGDDGDFIRAAGASIILLQELLATILACSAWGPSWWDLMVVVHSDNLEAVAVVNLGYSKVLPFLYPGKLQLLSAGGVCPRGPKWLG